MKYFRPKTFLLMASLVVFGITAKANSSIVKADAAIKVQPSMVVLSTNLNSDKVIKVPQKEEPKKSLKSTTAAQTKKKTTLNRGGSGISSASAGPSAGNSSVASYARQFVGRDYVWGAAGPNAFDCSGFTMYIFSKFGVSLPHQSGSQYRYGQSVSRDNLAPGDLVFFNTYGSISHVGIYAGGGNFVHAANSRTGVTVSSLSEGYYDKRFVGAKRVLRQ
jgi:cell wall-associated NlpC family hydrolase